MISAIILKPFAGFEVGKLTQLHDEDFYRLEASGFVKNENEKQVETVKKTTDKKANIK